MRKFFVNIFATTGISLTALSIVALFFQAKCIYLQTVFQVLGINMVIHFSIFFMSKLELKSVRLEMFLQIVLITAFLVVSGFVFRWFTSTPVWMLALMGAAVYMLSILLDIFCLKREVQEINALIKKRNRREDCELNA